MELDKNSFWLGIGSVIVRDNKGVFRFGVVDILLKRDIRFKMLRGVRFLGIVVF